MWMLEQLLGMVTAKYRQDKTSPGVVISKLDKTGRYYASVARYEDPWTKVVICSVYGESFEAAINSLAITWCDKVKLPVPTKSLAQQVKEKLTDRFDLIEIK